MIENTNKWSCLLDSFACVIGVSSRELIDVVGHNGEGVGFHTQEMLDAIAAYDLQFVEIHRNPVSVHYKTEDETFVFKKPNIRFARHLRGSYGVLMGYNLNLKPHAVAWKNNRIENPSTGLSYDLLQQNSETYLDRLVPTMEASFIPVKFLKIFNIT